LKFWDDIENRFDKAFYPKSDTPERIFQKKIVLNSAVSTVFISLGVALVTISFGFIGIAASFAAQAATLDLETQAQQIALLNELFDLTMEYSDKAFYSGFGIIFLGVILVMFSVIRQK